MHPRVMYSGRVRVTCLLAVLATASSCMCSDRPRGLEPGQRAALSACAQALESSVRARGAAKVQVLAQGCAPACPPLAAYGRSQRPRDEQVTALFAGCKLFCSAEAEAAWSRAAPAERFATLIRACGPETYGLTPASAPLLSDAWAVLLRVHEWLDSHRGRAGEPLRQALARAGDRAHFPLPLPARHPGVYALPAARAAAPSRSAFYIVIEPDRRVRAAAVPVARVRVGRLERRPVPGGDFPGQRLESLADDYAELVALFEGMHPSGTGRHSPGAPLVLADAATPVSVLLRVVADLDQTRFALGVAGRTALAHAIDIERMTTAGSAAPVLRVAPGEYTLEGGDQDVRVPAGDRERLAAELSELSVQWAPQDKLELVMPAGASVTELAAVLDIVAESRFQIALMRGEPR